ncbi:GD23019 [Drosophila simulans]|uniref:GD23019 n=1 Tax=Drosophila simulans TaxID=7240 RepID=B4NV12_DROSI|nr:GD23019 [Drosophila simulans]
MDMPITPFEPCEVAEVIVRQSNNKAPGHDVICNATLKALHRQAILYITTFVFSFLYRVYIFSRIEPYDTRKAAQSVYEESKARNGPRQPLPCSINAPSAAAPPGNASPPPQNSDAELPPWKIVPQSRRAPPILVNDVREIVPLLEKLNYTAGVFSYSTRALEGNGVKIQAKDMTDCSKIKEVLTANGFPSFREGLPNRHQTSPRFHTMRELPPQDSPSAVLHQSRPDNQKKHQEILCCTLLRLT